MTRRVRLADSWSFFSKPRRRRVPLLHQWVWEIINFRFHRWKSRLEAVRRWFIGLRQRARNSTEAKAEKIANDVYGDAAWRTRKSVWTDAIPWHLHSRRTRSAYKTDRSPNSSLVQQQTSSLTQTSSKSRFWLSTDGFNSARIFRLFVWLSNDATTWRRISVQLCIITK